MKKAIAAALLPVLLCGVTFADAPASSDSVTYRRAKQELLRLDSAGYATFIAAADELAQLGLYPQAVQLLSAQKVEVGGDSSRAPHDSVQPLRWRIQTGGEYLDYNDPQTRRDKNEIIDPHLLDDQRGYGSVAATWRPATGPAGLIRPEIELSSRNALGKLSVCALLLDSLLVCDLEGSAEKRFWHDVYDTVITPRGNSSLKIVDSKFVGDRRDALDVVSGGAQVTITNRNRHRRVTLSLPLRIAARHYRSGKPPFTSFAEYGVMPEITLATRDYTQTVLLQCEANYADFATITLENARRDTADRLIIRPEISHAVWRDAYSLDSRFSYLYENYRQADFPQSWGSVSLESKFGHRLLQRMHPSFAVAYRHENSRRVHNPAWREITGLVVNSVNPITNDTIYDTTFADKTQKLDYLVHGDYVKLVPSVSLEIVKILSSNLSFAYEESWQTDFRLRRQLAPTGKDTILWQDYLGEALRSYEPEIGLRLKRAAITASLSSAYRFTTSKKQGKYDYDQRSAWRFSADINFQPRKWLSCFAIFDGEFSRYDQQRTTQSNISLSGAIAASF
ncbi:MAG: hypothetical protein GF398_02570 [Chitinivibrionales bacterium]|nr:hypothetical protein [Chitinivibrionales bacterium]